jgi:hypothetical protein
VTCMLMKDGEPWISVFDGGDGKINGEVDGGGVFYFREKAFFFLSMLKKEMEMKQ